MPKVLACVGMMVAELPIRQQARTKNKVPGTVSCSLLRLLRAHQNGAAVSFCRRALLNLQSCLPCKRQQMVEKLFQIGTFLIGDTGLKITKQVCPINHLLD